MTEYRVRVRALPAQREALESDARIVLYCGGLGAGKSWTGALWCAMSPPKSRILVVAPSYRILRDGTVRTLQTVLPFGHLKQTEMRYGLPNGTQIILRSAENVDDTVRSVEPTRIWLEEGAYIRRDAIRTVLGRLRASGDGRVLCTTTPRKGAAIWEMWVRDQTPGVHIVTSRSEDNPRVNPEIIAMLRRDYGERLAAQELDGEWVDTSGGLFPEPQVSRRPERVDLTRVVVGVDPSAGGGDECGIVVAGRDRHGVCWVLDDASGRYGVDAWPGIVCELARQWRADIVAEANNGGDMVQRVIQAVDRSARVALVKAVKGKAERAMPVATLYRQGRVMHADDFPRLVAQLTGWDPETSSGSPDRLDACVWAITELDTGKKAGSWSEAAWSGNVSPTAADLMTGRGYLPW